jgi:hypothetical protein
MVSPGIFAVVAITLLPLLQWHCCHCQADIVALIMMALSPLLMRRRLCRCNNAFVALVVLVPLPKQHGCCCPCYSGVVVIIALSSFIFIMMVS